ncbi:hypothetical protein CRUP_010452, partial [Coryphaenoides rupestris]
MEQPACADSVLAGTSPSSTGPLLEPPEPKKVVVGPRRRTTSNTRHSNSSVGELLVHRGKCLGESERLGRSVYYGFEAHSGDFVVVYEWALQWSKKMGKFFTSQEKSKIEN